MINNDNKYYNNDHNNDGDDDNNNNNNNNYHNNNCYKSNFWPYTRLCNQKNKEYKRLLFYTKMM